MGSILRRGMQGVAVERLQRTLAAKGFRPGAIDGKFGPGTEAALVAFQRAHGLLPDGVAGPITWAKLEGDRAVLPADVTGRIDIELVSAMFPYTRLDSIASHLPRVLEALRQQSLVDKPMVLMALATIRAETETFEPVDELPSRFNTSPGGHAFDLYDQRADLGNRGRPDGDRYKGRGFVQLTGRANYRRIGQMIGLADLLEKNPERAALPGEAARVLAAFLASRSRPIKEALLDADLGRARRLVNGGRHGLDRFIEAYRTGDALIEDEVWCCPVRAEAGSYAAA